MAGTLGYYGYGAKLRKERRKFASEQAQTKMTFEDEQADKLAISRMAETERRQLGETKRIGIRERGLMERLKIGELGETERAGMRTLEGVSTARKTLGVLGAKDIVGIRTKAYDQLQKMWSGTRAPVWADPITGKALTPQQIRAKKREEWENLVEQYRGGL